MAPSNRDLLDERCEMHNRVTRHVIRMLVQEPLKLEGSYTDTLIMVETILFGAMMLLHNHGQDYKPYLKKMVEAVHQRYRLHEETAGHA